MTGFSAATQAWFDASFRAPTAAQEGAWDAISAGRNALVVAPTGSGKTLAAFLWSLDRLASEPAPAGAAAPLPGALRVAAEGAGRRRRAQPARPAGRHPARRDPARPARSRTSPSASAPATPRPTSAAGSPRTPPDILITTPESLFLLLTSQARESLRGVETVIVDEVHAVAGTKRGAHLALSLERLDALLERPAQRIGLSATVRPVEEVARFLGGAARRRGRAAAVEQDVDLEVVVPVEDIGELGQTTGEVSGSAAGEERRTSIWPHVEERIVDLVAGAPVDDRVRQLAPAGRAALPPGSTRSHQRAGDRRASCREPGERPARADHGAVRSVAAAPSAELARAHHGSVSKEQRARSRRSSRPAGCPRSSPRPRLELGIDMGAVDLVIQVESPPSVASGLQRVGRAGHQVGAVSRGVLFPKYRGDLVQTAVVVERMRAGADRGAALPAQPARRARPAGRGDGARWTSGTSRRCTTSCAARRRSPRCPAARFESVLDMLAGRYPRDEFAELRPRLVWDRVGGTLTGRPGAQRLAVTSGGTIPDRGLFGVFLVGDDESARARRVGELDEEMVYESRVGDVFTLGSTSWRIEDITHDRVLVTPAPGQPGRLPFWKGDTLGRPVELGRAVGAFVRELGGARRPARPASG